MQELETKTIEDIEELLKEIINLDPILLQFNLFDEKEKIEAFFLEDMKMRLLILSVYTIFDAPKQKKNLKAMVKKLRYRKKRFVERKKEYKTYYINSIRPLDSPKNNDGEYSTVFRNFTPKTLFPWYEYIIRNTKKQEIVNTRNKIFKTAIHPSKMESLYFNEFLKSINKKNPIGKYINYSASFYAFNERMYAMPIVFFKKKLVTKEERFNLLKDKFPFIINTDDLQKAKEHELASFLKNLPYNIFSKAPLTFSCLIEPINTEDLLLANPKRNRICAELWLSIASVIKQIDEIIINLNIKEKDQNVKVIKKECLEKLLNIYYLLRNEHPYYEGIQSWLQAGFSYDKEKIPTDQPGKVLYTIANRTRSAL